MFFSCSKCFSEGDLEQKRILMWNNQRHTVRIIAQELNLSRETFRLVLTENLSIRKICVKITTENLTSNQLLRRKKVCSDIWQRIVENVERLNRFITGDGRWGFSV
jgi:hypothetical protein